MSTPNDGADRGERAPEVEADLNRRLHELDRFLDEMCAEDLDDPRRQAAFLAQVDGRRVRPASRFSRAASDRESRLPPGLESMPQGRLAGLAVLSAYAAAATLLSIVCMDFAGDAMSYIAGRRTIAGVFVQLAVFVSVVAVAAIFGDSVIARLREALLRLFR